MILHLSSIMVFQIRQFCGSGILCSLLWPHQNRVILSLEGTLAYNFQTFALLDQQTDGAFVDLLGRITQVDARGMFAKLSKVVITIASADYFEQI